MTEDANAAYSYARCQGSKASVVMLYDHVRETMLDFAKRMGMKTEEIKK